MFMITAQNFCLYHIHTFAYIDIHIWTTESNLFHIIITRIFCVCLFICELLLNRENDRITIWSEDTAYDSG